MLSSVKHSLALALLLGASAAFAIPECATGSPPRVEVFAPRIELNFNAEVSRFELTKIAEQHRPGQADGLTVVHFGKDVRIATEDRLGDCPLGSIRVELRAERADVFLARELVPESCRFDAVVNHELQHVFIAQRALDAEVGVLKKAIRSYLQSPKRTDVTPTEEDMKAYIKRLVDTSVSKVVLAFADGSEKLDSHEESIRLADLCGEGEFKSETIGTPSKASQPVTQPPALQPQPIAAPAVPAAPTVEPAELPMPPGELPVPLPPAVPALPGSKVTPIPTPPSAEPKVLTVLEPPPVAVKAAPVEAVPAEATAAPIEKYFVTTKDPAEKPNLTKKSKSAPTTNAKD